MELQSRIGMQRLGERRWGVEILCVGFLSFASDALFWTSLDVGSSLLDF